ncbi:hypothetical protein J3Q64DRAFT_1301176 [Phycomyces blakesleeanus]|uniref:Uncharacterized protein n=1 Tax=Phycomyces blakesleeanus TaxID=4837 RepID=A0ABR3ALC0_PHYBL
MLYFLLIIKASMAFILSLYSPLITIAGCTRLVFIRFYIFVLHLTQCLFVCFFYYASVLFA